MLGIFSNHLEGSMLPAHSIFEKTLFDLYLCHDRLSTTLLP